MQPMQNRFEQISNEIMNHIKIIYTAIERVNTHIFFNFTQSVFMRALFLECNAMSCAAVLSAIMSMEHTSCRDISYAPIKYDCINRWKFAIARIYYTPSHTTTTHVLLFYLFFVIPFNQNNINSLIHIYYIHMHATPPHTHTHTILIHTKQNKICNSQGNIIIIYWKNLIFL